MSESKRKVSKKEYNKMYFKYYKDICGRMTLLEERMSLLEAITVKHIGIWKCKCGDYQLPITSVCEVCGEQKSVDTIV